ncbi:DUF2512 family protein [Laceyella putida]|uniref:DUF2512 family protein n=1 Tax=Laceyella putida TaxID=110101 RepID=A0ABW2RNP4_9BACL
MSHPFQLLIKFIYTSLILYLILGYAYHVPTNWVLFTSIVLTLLGYAMDVFFLHRLGNLFSTLSDLLVSFTVVWLIGTYAFDSDIGIQLYKLQQVPLFQLSLTISVIYSAIEWFFHRWIHRQSGRKELFP